MYQISNIANRYASYPFSHTSQGRSFGCRPFALFRRPAMMDHPGGTVLGRSMTYPPPLDSITVTPNLRLYLSPKLGSEARFPSHVSPTCYQRLTTNLPSLHVDLLYQRDTA